MIIDVEKSVWMLWRFLFESNYYWAKLLLQKNVFLQICFFLSSYVQHMADFPQERKLEI